MRLEVGSGNVSIHGAQKLNIAGGVINLAARNIGGDVTLEGGVVNGSLESKPLAAEEKVRTLTLSAGVATLSLALPEAPFKNNLKKPPFSVSVESNGQEPPKDETPHFVLMGNVGSGALKISVG